MKLKMFKHTAKQTTTLNLFNTALSRLILLILVCAIVGNAFNLSPKPNIVLREPITIFKTGMPKMRSSYFGFSINLKQNSLLVGAPRAQSSLMAQRKINETGAIYKCTFDEASIGNCTPFVFDPWGNINEDYNQYTYNNEKKDYQWLGASMDGNAHDGDKFVVCAPREVADITNHYLMHGVCYWTTNTSTSRPLNVQKIAPLRFKDKQQNIIDQERYFYYMYGEQGLSVHITEDNEEILIGAPGIFTWKGSVIRHKAKPLVDLGGLSRRDDDSSAFPRLQRQHGAQSDAVEYSSDIPNPMLWGQDDNSYFGFAVSSGYFDGPGKSKLLYVASAPQANSQQGEVYIFDIVDHYAATDKTIKIYYTFSGGKFGEYFGYNLLTEDFNNDGFTDLAISAPYYSKSGSYENGAVYIYRNEGSSSNFALHTILLTEYAFSGRFGTTISKVGDVNQDGFNDLIVAAPFEDNGAVYIYHGGPNGISSKPSQRLSAPIDDLIEPFTVQMFGHGLSKGVDIDANQYLDIAIGAPNAEAVYLFKSYPIVRINASITPFTQEIQTTDRSFKFNVCWLIELTFPLGFLVDFHASVKLDGQLGRATFADKTNQYEINGKITTEEQCRELEAFVTFNIADIFKPIELEMSYNVLNGVPQESKEFCKNCVAVNPNDSKMVKNKIVFSTGCKKAKCIADLKINSSLQNIASLPYILGSTTTLSIDYNIENNGETAYLAQIRVTLPEIGVDYSKTPSHCKIDEAETNFNVMECDLNGGSPMFKGDKTSLKISIDTTKLDGNELLVKAQVFSTGDELNESDNFVEDAIPLGEFSEVEILGDSSKDRLSLETGLRLENLTHTFEIRNNGPSNIKSLDVLLSLPISHINPWTLERESLIDISSISIKSVYNNQPLNVEWTQNNTILILDAVESSTAPPNVPVEDFNGMQFDASKIGLEYDLNGDAQNNAGLETLGERRRRSITSDVRSRRFNPYLQKVVESNNVYEDSTIAIYENQLYRNRRDIFNPNDHILANLPVNRTIYFDCQNAEQESCLQAKFTVTNFRTGNLPILISLNFTIDLKKIDKIVTEKRDIFVVRTSAELMKSADEDTSSLHVVQTQPYTIISKYVTTTTPLWVYIVSIIFGILTLILITYGLHRLGFFKRGKREELVKLKRQSEAMAYYPNPNEDED